MSIWMSCTILFHRINPDLDPNTVLFPRRAAAADEPILRVRLAGGVSSV